VYDVSPFDTFWKHLLLLGSLLLFRLLPRVLAVLHRCCYSMLKVIPLIECGLQAIHLTIGQLELLALPGTTEFISFTLTISTETGRVLVKCAGKCVQLNSRWGVVGDCACVYKP
jgi:hypothetical protein